MVNSIAWDQETYLKAWHVAAIAHLDQLYPGSTISYIFHVGMVAMEVMGAFAQAGDGYDQNLALQCALLHDTLEDTNLSYEEICDDFGIRVAEGVKALTKNGALPKAQQMVDSIDRLLEQPLEVQLVKLADRITNLQCPPSYWTTEKISNYVEEAQMIRDRLGQAHPLLATRLEQKIMIYHAKFLDSKPIPSQENHGSI